MYLYDGESFVDGNDNFVVIQSDFDCDSPRNYDNLGTFVTWMRNYSSPDNEMTPENIIDDLGLWEEFEKENSPSDDEIEAYEEAHDEWGDEVGRITEESYNAWKASMDAWYETVLDYAWYGCQVPKMPVRPTFDLPEEPEDPYDKYGDLGDDDLQLRWLLDKASKKEIYLLPVSGYSHGGLTLSVGSPTQFPDWQWDAGFAGVIYTTPERVKQFMGENRTHEEVLNALESEVEYYNMWLNGNCWGFNSYDKHGDDVDSCWGFIGDTTECIEHEFVGGLHETEYRSLSEYLDAHKDDSEVLVAEYNEMRKRFDNLSSQLGEKLREIVNEKHIPVSFNDGRLVMEVF